MRICVDLSRLNESVCRERHPLPVVEQVLAQLTGAKLFSKLDANSGFWQIPLSPESALLTTFITPFRWFCYHQLPFGNPITSAPEHFQKRMLSILSGVEGVLCMMDDILVHGKTQEEHDNCLLAVLQRIQRSILTLNKEKCFFSLHEVKFLGLRLLVVRESGRILIKLVRFDRFQNQQTWGMFLGVSARQSAK